VLLECSKEILVPTAAGRGVAAPKGFGDSEEFKESRNFLKESRGFEDSQALRGPNDFFIGVWKTQN
jgi:hypothetical protein